MSKTLVILFVTLFISIGIIFAIYKILSPTSQLPTPPLLDSQPPSSQIKPNISTIPNEQPSPSIKQKVSDSCIIGGCSSQLCVDAKMGDVASTCEWREEYRCYQSATCEMQVDGKCGWTITKELQQCLVDARTNNNQQISF